MSKHKCSIPKGSMLFTNPRFIKPFNYLLIDKVNGLYTWCNHDLTEKLTGKLFPIDSCAVEIMKVSRQVIR